MALQLTLTTENGITLEDAYIKVTSVFIQPKERMQIKHCLSAKKQSALRMITLRIIRCNRHTNT
jgi:predicted component of type VI protein secretion system